MAAIDQYLRAILEAEFGEEVRGSIHDAILQNYMDISDAVSEAHEAADAAEQAVADANSAIAGVNAVVDRANAASTTANSASQRAQQAADLVEEIVDDYGDATATATSLPSGSAPTVSLVDGSSGKEFRFGIPAGAKGDKGDDGQKGDKGDDGDPGVTPSFSIGTVTSGATPSATITGTAEAPVLNLTLPKGDKGDDGNDGNTGATPHLTIGTVTTGAAGSSAQASIRGTDENPILDLTIPRGDTGEVENVYGDTLPMSSSDSTKVATVIGQKANSADVYTKSQVDTLIAGATDSDAVHSINGKTATDHAVTLDASDIQSGVTGQNTTVADDIDALSDELDDRVPPVQQSMGKYLRDDYTWATPTGGSGSTAAVVHRTWTIPVSGWVQHNNEYWYTNSTEDTAIVAGMYVDEFEIDENPNNPVQLGDVDFAVTDGYLTIKTTVLPVAQWVVSIGLNMDGASTMEDVHELTTPFVGATSSTNGRQGLVPRPDAGEEGLFLCANGDWATPPGSKTTTKTIGPLTPDQSTNVLNATFTDNTINGSMKATKIEVSTPSVFLDSVYVTCNDGSITVTCGKMSGECQSMTVTIVLPASTSDITSVEFDVLAARIGSLDELPTTDKSSIVAAINEQSDQIANLQNGLAYVENGDNATIKTYTDGEYIVWKGTLYTVNSGGIPQGYPITGHVTAVTGGGFNDQIVIKSGIFNRNCNITTQQGSVFADISNVNIPLPVVSGKSLIGVTVAPYDGLIWISRVVVSGNNIIRMPVYAGTSQTLTDQPFTYMAFYK